MPGYANWKDTFFEERRIMALEGYDISPTDSLAAKENESEPYWQDAYEKLWALRANGIKKDYPYEEPEDFESIIASASKMPSALEPLSDIEYENRIAGAVRGRCGGVVLGKPFELHLDRSFIKQYLESTGDYPLNDFAVSHSEKLDFTLGCKNSTRNNISFIENDDDINYTIYSLLLAEKKGFDFTHYDIGETWLKNSPYYMFWCASRMAYYGMVSLRSDISAEEQIKQFPYKTNPWRECIDGQIRSDMWGYLNPADPLAAAKIAYKDCSFSLIKNGCYGGMYVAGCIAAALSKNPDVKTIINGGLSVIPKKSRLTEAVLLTVKWWEESKDFNVVCEKIENRYKDLTMIDTINNLAVVTLALLYGNLNYTKTITCAVMCGLDTDCNGGTAGSICGAAIGNHKVDARWTAPFNDSIHSTVAEFGSGKISELINRTIVLHQKLKK